jgi:hypothetical protein
MKRAAVQAEAGRREFASVAPPTAWRSNRIAPPDRLSRHVGFHQRGRRRSYRPPWSCAWISMAARARAGIRRPLAPVYAALHLSLRIRVPRGRANRAAVSQTRRRPIYAARGSLWMSRKSPRRIAPGEPGSRPPARAAARVRLRGARPRGDGLRSITRGGLCETTTMCAPLRSQDDRARSGLHSAARSDTSMRAYLGARHRAPRHGTSRHPTASRTTWALTSAIPPPARTNLRERCSVALS